MGETVDAQRVSGVYLEAAPDERIVKTNKTRDKRTHCAQLGHRITTERNSDYTACQVPEAGGSSPSTISWLRKPNTKNLALTLW